MSAHRRTLPTTALALVLGGALLAGCGADDETPTPTPTEAATATADPVEETAEPDDAAQTTATAEPEPEPEPVEVSSADGAFTLRAPAGWVDVSESYDEAEVAVRAEEPAADFTTNVVVTSEDPIDDLEESVEEAAEQIAGEDGRWTMLPVVAIGGVDAPGYVVHRTVEDVDIAQVQRWVEREDRLYVLTLSTAAEEESAARQVFDMVIQSWTWTD